MKFLFLGYSCKLECQDQMRYKLWNNNLEYQLKQAKLLLMFESHQSMDSLIVQFLQKLCTKSDIPQNRVNLITLTFMEQLRLLSKIYELNYVQEWSSLQIQKLKNQWKIQQEKKIKSIQQSKLHQSTKRKSKRFSVPLKRNQCCSPEVDQLQKQQKMQNIVVGSNQSKQQFNYKLNIYRSNKKVEQSEHKRRRTIHQERSKYTAKAFAEQIIFTEKCVNIKTDAKISENNKYMKNTIPVYQVGERSAVSKRCEYTDYQERDDSALALATPPKKTH